MNLREERGRVVGRLTVLRREVGIELESKHGGKGPVLLGDKATEELQAGHLVDA